MYCLNEEQLNYRNRIRRYVNDVICPIASKLDMSGEFPHQIVRECGKAGFLDVLFSDISKQHKSALEGVLFLEEISRGLGSLGLIFCPQFQGITLLHAAKSDCLKQEVLTAALNGEKILAYAIGEESGGTNALEIQTSAVPDGDDWIINGSKCWITNAGIADGYIISAKTSAYSNRRSINYFYIDCNDAGLVIDDRSQMTGLRNSVMGSIHFHDCRIPKERLISTSENGYDLMKLSLNQGRLQLSAVACGIAQRAMELALDYTCERSQYARSLYSYQSISFTISEMYAHIMPLRNMIYHTAELCQLQKPYSLEVSALKIFANEVCNTICMQAQDIHGAYGLSTNSDIERCMRDSRMLNAAEGTVQACKMTIASALPQEPIEHFL